MLKRLSRLKINEVGTLNGKLFMVKERYSEDRDTGITHIEYSTGRKESFQWDCEDPFVEVMSTENLK